MTPATGTSYPPVARNEHLDRLAVSSSGPDAAPELWTEVHEETQAQLAPLETEVRRKVAGIRVETGRTVGNQFFLFTYRTFSMPDSDIDPVVAGITFTPAHDGVTVEADVSGEQSGDWISSAQGKTVASSRDELLWAARELARGLCSSAEAIADALKNPSRRVE